MTNGLNTSQILLITDCFKFKTKQSNQVPEKKKQVQCFINLDLGL